MQEKTIHKELSRGDPFFVFCRSEGRSVLYTTLAGACSTRQDSLNSFPEKWLQRWTR